MDCFSDREQGLMYCAGRDRIRTRSGISMHCRDVEDPEFVSYAERLGEKLTFHGAWFFQLRRDQRGVLKLLEIGPRIAGTMALHRVQGVNFALLSLREQDRLPIEISPQRFDLEIDRALLNRYRCNLNYDRVYVDLCDTLLCRGHVDLDLVRFLYQCVNRGVALHLYAKSHGCGPEVDPRELLDRHRLAGLFDQVDHVSDDGRGAVFAEMRKGTAILIDNDCTQRKLVHERCGIMTFDVSMIEMLLDERT